MIETWSLGTYETWLLVILGVSGFVIGYLRTCEVVMKVISGCKDKAVKRDVSDEFNQYKDIMREGE